MQVVRDEDVRALLTPQVAVASARAALMAAWSGQLVSPPRLHAELGGLELVVTAGGFVGGPAGFRAYGTWAGESDQLVAVWTPAGRLRGVVIGAELGERRTGALGAVAADALAREDSRTVAVIGSGRQAWSQLWALTAVRRIDAVRVFSPDRRHREAYAERARRELGVDTVALEDAQRAVAGADIVVLATRSPVPVIASEWIAEGVHVTTVGPKQRSAHETPSELIERADVLVSDSPSQAAAYDEPFFSARRLAHLGSVLAGDTPGRTAATDLTIYCSTGLAGSEVAIADALLDTLPSRS